LQLDAQSLSEPLVAPAHAGLLDRGAPSNGEHVPFLPETSHASH
jgi:hypothetical protein